MKTVKIW